MCHQTVSGNGEFTNANCQLYVRVLFRPRWKVTALLLDVACSANHHKNVVRIILEQAVQASQDLEQKWLVTVILQQLCSAESSVDHAYRSLLCMTNNANSSSNKGTYLLVLDALDAKQVKHTIALPPKEGHDNTPNVGGWVCHNPIQTVAPTCW